MALHRCWTLHYRLLISTVCICVPLLTREVCRVAEYLLRHHLGHAGLRQLRGAPDGLPDPLFNGSPAVTISNLVIVLRHNFPADIVARALENADGAFQSTVLRLEAFFTSEGAQNFVVHHSSFCSSSQQFCSSSHGEAIDVKWGRRRLLWSLCDVRACCALMTRQARCCLFVDHGDVQQT